MKTKIKHTWEYVQSLMDMSGDSIMCLMSLVFIGRVAMTAYGHPGLNCNEAALYASAIGCFAYSNKSGPKI